MLDLMRRQSYLIYLVFGGIICIFAINFGPGSSGCMRTMSTPWAARINGEVVRQQEFMVGYGRQMDFMRRMAEQSGIEFNDALAERFGIRAKAMEQLVERRLLAQEAARRGVLISDRDLLGYLRQQYGVKDVSFDVYENWVTHTFATNVQKFEEGARAEVAARRMARLVHDSIEVSNKELEDIFRREHDRAKIEYVSFAVDPNVAAAPTPAEIDTALATQGPALLAAYEADRRAYWSKPAATVRHILRTLPADADEGAVAAQATLLRDVAARLKRGADFAQQARAHSQDATSRDQGGALGRLDAPALAQALQRSAGPDVAAAAGATGPARGSGRWQQVATAIMRQHQGEVTAQPVRSPAGLHLFEVTEAFPPVREPFDQVRVQVATAWVREQAADAAARARGEALLAQLAGGMPWGAASKKMAAAAVGAPGRGVGTSAKRGASDWILRAGDMVGELGTSKSLHDAVFALSTEKPVAQKAYRVGQDYVIVALSERETPAMQEFAEARPALYERAVEQKRSQVLQEWLAYLRAQSRVEINTALTFAPLVDDEDAGPEG